MENLLKKSIDEIISKIENKKKGKVIVISGPSAAGKTTLCRELLKKNKNLVFSISYTTRPKKEKEKDGVDYYFVSEDKFLDMIKNNEFIEWAKVHNYYYGTPRKKLIETIESGKDILLDIDVQGAKTIKKFFSDGVFIFILPPSGEVLKRRIVERKRDNPKEITLRLKNALKEIKNIKYYDYVVINDKLNKTLEILNSIITAEKYKIKGDDLPWKT